MELCDYEVQLNELHDGWLSEVAQGCCGGVGQLRYEDLWTSSVMGRPTAKPTRDQQSDILLPEHMAIQNFPTLWRGLVHVEDAYIVI